MDRRAQKSFLGSAGLPIHPARQAIVFHEIKCHCTKYLKKSPSPPGERGRGPQRQAVGGAAAGVRRCEMATDGVSALSRSNARGIEQPKIPIPAFDAVRWILIVPQHVNLLSGRKLGEIDIGGKAIGVSIAETHLVLGGRHPFQNSSTGERKGARCRQRNQRGHAEGNNGTHLSIPLSRLLVTSGTLSSNRERCGAAAAVLVPILLAIRRQSAFSTTGGG